jgi:hypothetical protein
VTLGEIVKHAASLGITECHLLLEDPPDYRLALSYSERLGLRYPGISGKPRHLVRRTLPEHGHQAMAVLPLFGPTRHLGYLLVNLTSRLPIAYEAVRTAFSGSLDAMLR